MKRILPLLLFSCLCGPVRADCTGQIRAFYTAYLTHVLHDGSRNEALCGRYLTPELIAKVQRMAAATGGDPIIRAQDANEDALATLRVKALGEDWYMVSYRWNGDDPETVCEIPVKARTVDGRCRITYITPPWHGTRYGDELLAVGPVAPVDPITARAFLTTFYDAYTAVYCAMPHDLQAQLDRLRTCHLTPHAQEQFARAEAENRLDGLAGYDRVIGHFDLDCLWRRSLAVEPLGGNRFRISYRTGASTQCLIVTVVRDEEGCRIDGIAWPIGSETQKTGS